MPDTVAVRSTPFKGAVPELGEAERETERMRISTESKALPPGPEQEMAKVVVEVRLPEEIPALDVPEEKAEPFLVTEQEVALEDVQEMVEEVL